jgi:signal transduction histidine kinase
MRLLHLSIRQRIRLLVLIPILSLIGVYAYAVATTIGNAVMLDHATAVTNELRGPNTDVQQQLDIEGLDALLYLASPTHGNLTTLDNQETVTNQAVGVWRGFATSRIVNADVLPREKRAIATLGRGLTRLALIRRAIASKTITPLSVLSFYNGLEINGFQVYDGWIVQATSVPLVSQGLALTKLGEAEQAAIDENDLLTSSLATRSFTRADRAEFTSLAAVRQFLIAQNAPNLADPYRGFYAKDVSARTSADLTRMESAVISKPDVRGLPAVQPGTWVNTAIAYITGLETMLARSGDIITSQAQDQAYATYRRLALIGGLGLLAILVSAAVSVAVGGRIVRQLDDLRTSAEEVANERLPSVMRALRLNQDVTMPSDPAAPALGRHEVGQVWQAFSLLQKAAIGAAMDEARLRRGISDLFQSLARRSQSLLHRQLAMLDRMEREAEKPEELDKLFRIDHLTTRMRRHAESLIILSGELPGRGWEHPVPLDDVLRAAVAEVEDYARIRVMVRTKAALAGQAVADVVHLVAELAENAAIFSPPNTPVRILGDVAGRGFCVEIEDRGVGMTPEQMIAINRDLAHPPEFDLSGGDHLGLFIAGRLAHRHGIKITVRESPFGGIDAIVLIPRDLVVEEDPAAVSPPATAANGARFAPRPGGRHPGQDQDSRMTASIAVADPVPPVLAEPFVTADGQEASDPQWPEADSSGHLTGLPARVRFASLPPDLRDNFEPGQPANGTNSARPDSPEATRRAMAELQHGWEAGWSAATAHDEATPAVPPTEPGVPDNPIG